jgi:hypothetical protein
MNSRNSSSRSLKSVRDGSVSRAYSTPKVAVQIEQAAFFIGNDLPATTYPSSLTLRRLCL